jgi:hypothetical protein
MCAREAAVPPIFGDIGTPWAADLARKAGNGKDDPTSHCLPDGIAKLHAAASGRCKWS